MDSIGEIVRTNDEAVSAVLRLGLFCPLFLVWFDCHGTGLELQTPNKVEKALWFDYC